MASYIQGTLSKGEEVRYQAHISLWSLSHWIVFGLLLIPLYGVGFILLIVALIRYKTTELAFTNKRVVAKAGLISRYSVEIYIPKVESIQVEQSVLGRIFNYGSLIIAGAGYPKAPIPGISDPMAFRREFMEIQEQVVGVK